MKRTIYFRTVLSVFSKHLPQIPDLLGMPASESAVFGKHHTEIVPESKIPEKVREFFLRNSNQMEFSFEEGKKDDEHPTMEGQKVS